MMNEEKQTDACSCQNTAIVEKNKEFIQMTPPVDILESNNDVMMWFEIPGANSNTVKIEVKEHIMNIEAESSLRRNGKFIAFKREFQLSDKIDTEHISAKTADGVLTLTLPKSEKAKVHRVKVE